MDNEAHKEIFASRTNWTCQLSWSYPESKSDFEYLDLLKRSQLIVIINR
jgi:hypothetical protein